MDEIVREFLVESYENLDQLDRDLVALEGTPGSRELLGSVFRTIHTIKGTCGFLAFGLLERVTHAGESLLAELRDGRRVMDLPTTDALLSLVDTVRELLASIETSGTEGDVAVDDVIDQIHRILEDTTAGAVAGTALPAVAGTALPAVAGRATGRVVGEDVPPPTLEGPADDLKAPTVSDSSIRVEVDVLDALMRQVGELVLARNQINRLADDRVDADLARASQRLTLISAELQQGVLKARMQPIGHLWQKMPRIVRDLALTCGRQVRLEVVGGDTELDRTLLEAVKDPLMHLVRNAVDHGIEAPAVRLAAGKSAVGVLTLLARHEGGQVVVEVMDDGKGIDHDRVAAMACERGLYTPQQISEMGVPDLLQLLFVPGFSMAETVGSVSGRGVGMDVVRTKIAAIGGSVEVQTRVGLGTTWRLRIPLTLAIIAALTVECSGELYAIPQVSLMELVALDGLKNGAAIEYAGTAPVFRLRGALMPLVELRGVLGQPLQGRTDGSAVVAVLQADERRFGLIVDRVLSVEEIVVKPLSARLRGVGVYSGATLFGDGRVSLILDVQAIARLSLARRSVATDREPVAAPAPVDTAAEQVLLVAIRGGRRVAIPLRAVTRLERLPSDVIEHVGGREVVQYRRAIVPLVRLEQLLGGHVGPAVGDLERRELLVVVFTRGARSVAIAVEEILDIVADDASRHSRIDDRGVVGSAVLGERVTELLDVRQIVLAGDPSFFDDDVNDWADQAEGVDQHDGTNRFDVSRSGASLPANAPLSAVVGL